MFKAWKRKKHKDKNKQNDEFENLQKVTNKEHAIITFSK